ncbi:MULTISPECIES: hypothetical protein [unclassified Mesorhizobium]|uniref:hypothetical protein n=2 Tax=Mesorhizobium TaxID=68287 RepID=UPI001FDF9BEE|nr:MULTISPECIES: hypothetical protein [unclassified Mesorhizobium]
MHILAIVIVFAVREPFRLPSCSTSRPLAKMIAVGCVLVLAAALYVIALADFPHRVDGDAAAQANNAMEFLVGNGRHYGGGNVVEETAEIDDGHLDLYSLEMTNLWKLALMLRSFRSGTHGAWREVRTARCVEFDIETEKPMPVNTDGEIVTSTPAHFKVHAKAISVFAPPPVGIRRRTEGAFGADL